MPSDVNLWIVAVVVLALVVAVAVWFGRSVNFSWSLKGFTFRTAARQEKHDSIKVGEKAKVGGDLRRMVGVTGAGEAQQGSVEVGKGSEIKGKVDEMIGVERGRSKQNQ
jgi:hypothetical protein